MKLHKMNLKDVVKNLRYCYNTGAIFGDDDERTLFINNISYEEYKRLTDFDVNIFIREEYKECPLYKNEVELIENYILPKLVLAKKSFMGCTFQSHLLLRIDY